MFKLSVKRVESEEHLKLASKGSQRFYHCNSEEYHLSKL